MKFTRNAFLVLVLALPFWLAQPIEAATRRTVRKPAARTSRTATSKKTATAKRRATAHTARRSSASRTRAVAVKRAAVKRSRGAWGPISDGVKILQSAFVAGGPWTEPTYADSTLGDLIDGEDMAVRQAAVEALGSYNGSIVVTEADTGRILTLVNQKLALGQGCQPCSTVKVPVALAAISEGLVDRATPVHLYGRVSMNMTDAMARSNNYYFANLGLKMGYEKLAGYLKLYGYGEKAGWNIAGEQAGALPSAAPANGGVGMMSSFGEEIRQTPLQAAALMGAIANGGSLYYLQYPRTLNEAAAISPKLKRQIQVNGRLGEIVPGLEGAVNFGTARRADLVDGIAGKTGTCTEGRRHLGWFSSYATVQGRKLVVVVMLTGGRPAIGSTASGIAGAVYSRLSQTPMQVVRYGGLTPAAILPLVK